MVDKGLTKKWVQEQSQQYGMKITQAGQALERNAQLVLRKALMDRILELWPE
jgi:hypothetical protein